MRGLAIGFGIMITMLCVGFLMVTFGNNWGLSLMVPGIGYCFIK